MNFFFFLQRNSFCHLMKKVIHKQLWREPQSSEDVGSLLSSLDELISTPHPDSTLDLQ